MVILISTKKSRSLRRWGWPSPGGTPSSGPSEEHLSNKDLSDDDAQLSTIEDFWEGGRAPLQAGTGWSYAPWDSPTVDP